MEEKNIESVELKQDELQGVEGGYKNDQETCPHNGGFNYIHKYRNMGPGKNDWGYHLQMQKRYYCKLCGKGFWEDELPW